MSTARDDYPAARDAAFYSVANAEKHGDPHPDSRIAQLRAMFDEIDALRAENRELRRLADLNALRRTLTDPTLRRITRTADK